ncbi:19270_t:CDS:2 [Racocetra fulgida]|uniref:19270_t:CDS:1 n=1 Tax=Racocetra fulgida TaxID=60492 RepID=A0A9N8VW92_9GLOM|nr:19270_t:CDS:2 [Racocetra fulgida]
MSSVPLRCKGKKNENSNEFKTAEECEQCLAKCVKVLEKEEN